MQNLPTKLFTAGLTCLFGTIIIFWVLVPGVIHWKVTQTLRLKEGNEIWDVWTNIDAEIFFKCYIYNVTNPDEVAEGAIPKLDEIGPYVYEEKRKNIPIRVNEEDDTLTYKTHLLFYFRPDLSNGSDEDVITMLNVPMVAVANELNNWSTVIRSMAKYYVNSFEEPLFVQRKVKVALFEGVHMELVESVSSLLGLEYLPNNTFGYFYEKNDTAPNELVMIAGNKDNTRFGEIVSWNGRTKLDMWGGESCNMINGSDTSLYPPFITKESILRGFEPDICRSATLVFDRDDEYDGVKGYRYTLPKDFFNSKTPDNQCFCMEQDKSKCPKSGTLSVAPCKFGAPLLISHPHFLHADPYYNEVTGLSPGIAEKHEAHVIIEPTTGGVLTGHKRMQLNILMKKSNDVPILKNVRDNTVFPLVWIDEYAAQPPHRMEDMRWRMVIPLKAVEVGKWLMLVISSTITVVGVFIFMVRTKNKKPVEYY